MKVALNNQIWIGFSPLMWENSPHQRALLCNNWLLLIFVLLGEPFVIAECASVSGEVFNSLWRTLSLCRRVWTAIFPAEWTLRGTLLLTGQLLEDEFAPCVWVVCADACGWCHLSFSSPCGKAVVFLRLSNGCLAREAGVWRPCLSKVRYCSMNCSLVELIVTRFSFLLLLQQLMLSGRHLCVWFVFLRAYSSWTKLLPPFLSKQLYYSVDSSGARLAVVDSSEVQLAVFHFKATLSNSLKCYLACQTQHYLQNISQRPCRWCPHSSSCPSQSLINQ